MKSPQEPPPTLVLVPEARLPGSHALTSITSTDAPQAKAPLRGPQAHAQCTNVPAPSKAWQGRDLFEGRSQSPGTWEGSEAGA